MSSSEHVEVIDEYRVGFKKLVGIVVARGLDGKLRYVVNEPRLDPSLKPLKDFVYKLALSDVGVLRALSAFQTFEEGYEYAKKLVEDGYRRVFKKKASNPASLEGLEAVVYYVLRDFVGYGEIDPLIRDPDIEDVTCDGAGRPIYVFHKRFEWLESNKVLDPRSLETVVRKLAYRANREATLAQPIVEGIVRPEGYRVHIVLEPVSLLGHSFTVRKFKERPFTVVELMNGGVLDAGVAALLWLAAENKQGVIFYGTTGSGKTTLLNAFMMLLPPEMKVVTCEDTQEIRLPFHDNWVSMVTRLSTDPSVRSVTLQDQVESAMRQRPDVLVIGEIRSRESYSFFQAVATGHGGMTTIHAEDVPSVIRRLTAPPMNVPTQLLATAKLFVQVQRLVYKGSVARKVTQVHEVEGYDPAQNRLSVRLLCRWIEVEDEWAFNLRGSRTLGDVARLLAIGYEGVLEDLKRRATVLLYAAKKELDIARLHELVRRYRREPQAVYMEALELVKEPYRFRTLEAYPFQMV